MSAVIILLAFASGSEVVLSRLLAMTEISTAMVTAAWVDLLIDPHLWGWKIDQEIVERLSWSHCLRDHLQERLCTAALAPHPPLSCPRYANFLSSPYSCSTNLR